MNKPVLSIDIDDVLAPSAQAFIDFSNKKWGTHLSLEDYDEHWSKVWQIDNQRELEDRVKAIDKADFYGRGCPHPQDQQSKEALNRLKLKFKIITITSRRSIKKDGTVEWLEKHYPGIFDDYIFAGIWDNINSNEGWKDRINKNKGSLLKELNVAWHIDDQPKHCIGAEENGIDSILFGDYGWNQDFKLGPRMRRASNWLEVEDILNEWLKFNER